jgi:hypothetical protein
MGRIWIALAVGLCLMAAGCPKPLPVNGQPAGLAGAGAPGGDAAANDANAELEASASAAPGGPPTDPNFIGPVQPSATATAPASAGSAPATGGADQTAAAGPVGPQLPPGYTPPTSTTPPTEATPSGGGSAAGTPPAARDAMDPNAVKDDLINGPPGIDAQQRGLRDTSLAGSWQVVCATTGGQPRWYEPETWKLRLDPNGNIQIERQDGGQIWKQHGSWQAEGDRLSLNLGPGGEHAYTVAGDDADVKTLAEPSSQTTLFILRQQPGAVVPQLYQNYQTDFGPLTFTANGPGRWTGSYGEPAGKLALRLRGPFCVGTWEQAPARGGVIMRLSHTGFTGWWWYDGSLAFDGRWDGSKGG